MSSPNHPRYYGQDKSCWWSIEPEPGKHIELNFIIYDLAEKEDIKNSGRCRDELTVYTGSGNNSIIKSPDGILFPKRIISNGLMKIHLESCFRYSRSRYRGFYATYKSVGMFCFCFFNCLLITKYFSELAASLLTAFGSPKKLD